jgi:2C-methyl-D-erythritol 2,4-cyclodiphosphate synthase
LKYPNIHKINENVVNPNLKAKINSVINNSDNDAKWKGADSSIFMEEAYKKMTEKGDHIHS